MSVAPEQLTIFNLNQIKLQSSEGSVKLQEQCRICLETKTQSNQKLINPCNCNGSLKYVHEGCYFAWAKSIIQKKSSQQKEQLKQKGLSCELCKKKVYLIFQSVRQCLNKDQLVKQIIQNQCVALILIVFILISIGTLAFIIQYMQSLNSPDQNPSTTSKFFSVVAIIIMTLFMFGGIYMFVTKFLFVLKTQITGYRQNLKAMEREQ